MKIVIRAGGIGSRLWPMSRQNNPKQFQKLLDNNSMIRNTYDRLSDLSLNKEDYFVSINESMLAKLKNELPEINEKNIIVETDTRNTGPAMCLEVCYLEKFCSRDEVIASLPSDDYISNNKSFADLLKISAEFLEKNNEYIITPAVKPETIDVGYSYLKAGNNLKEVGEANIFEVVEVVEKPSFDYCKELVESGNYYCHTGMYIWKLGYIIDLFKKYQSEMFAVCSKIVEMMINNEPLEKIKELYSGLEKMTIESAITNKVNSIAMSVSDKVGWSDVGKWHIIKRILSKEGDNLIKGEVIVNESKNNLIYNAIDNKKIIALNDCSDLVVVDTGDALFISSLKKSDEVKKIVEELKQDNFKKYL